MRGSLFFKLMGAFAVVILVGVVVVFFLTNRAAASDFRVYATRSGQLWAQGLAPLAADYYARTGSWETVAALLESSMGMMDSGMMRGMMGPNRREDRDTGRDMWTMMGQRLLLVDAQGRVVSDTMDELVGKTLSSEELAVGAPIIVESGQIGTLILTSLDAVGLATPAGEFLSSVNRSILLASLAAAALALVLGSLLFFQLTAPIRGLTSAARSIATGDLTRRVPERSQDELGELAQAFNTMADSLAQAEEQRRHMVADIAHELRTPLSIIQGSLEGMLDRVLPLDFEQVASVHEETLLLGRLVADLRLLSLAEARQLDLERAETDLSGLIGKVVERMRPVAQEKGIILEASLPPSLPSVSIDTGRINQVLDNLVGNAMRYSPVGGRVSIQTSLVSGRIGAGQYAKSEQQLLTTVTDTGTGITPEDLPHVFDRFYRADKSRTRSSGGSGLGLAIAKHLVELHGGQVWAESPVQQEAGQPDYGSRFSFTLPATGPIASVGGRGEESD